MARDKGEPGDRTQAAHTFSAVPLSCFSRDGAGNPLSMQDWNGTAAYAYDMYSRLGSVTDYDQVGNRYAGTWSYNAVDQLIGTPSHTYDYLMTGSLANKLNAAGTLVEKSYTYTYANLLSAVTHYDSLGNPVSASSMAWDGDSNRISFTSSQGGTTQFVYDTTAGIPAVVEEVLPSTQSVYYIREPNGALIARMAGTTGANTRYYHFDALGSTRLLTDSTGAVTDTYSYDAWGNTTHTGSITQPYQYVGQLGYYTHYQDANLPLLQLRVRFYDPALGRFTQRDPLTYESGTYRYCGLQSTVGVDPSGLAYMKFDGTQLCLYHGNGRVWMCCDGKSGTPGKIPPIAPGKHRLDPSNICCVNEGGPLSHPRWKCQTDAWGNWRCHLEPVKIQPGCEDEPHDECFVHGGCSDRPGTAGCIRLPDKGTKGMDCLEKLMRLLKRIGTPVGVDVCY